MFWQSSSGGFYPQPQLVNVIYKQHIAEVAHLCVGCHLDHVEELAWGYSPDVQSDRSCLWVQMKAQGTDWLKKSRASWGLAEHPPKGQAPVVLAQNGMRETAGPS